MRKKLKDPVYIMGVGCTKFGNLIDTPEIEGLTVQELSAQAAIEAIEDAHVDPKEIDAVFVGNAMNAASRLSAMYTQLSKWIGTQFKAGVHFEAQCSTTNVGACMAAMAIASGVYDKVLVIGVETALSQPKGLSPYEREKISREPLLLWTNYAANQAYQVPQGYDIFPVYSAFLALGYCRKYGYSIEEYDHYMFELNRNRRFHGSLTPKAIMQETLEEEARRKGFDDPYEFWQSSQHNEFMSWPARLRSHTVSADGASAILLSRADGVCSHSVTPIELLGFGIACSDLPWYGSDPTLWPIDQLSFQKAYQMAGITPRDIHYMNTHDCSHISGICSAELSGYLPEGEGLKYAQAGRLRFDGDYPMSTHGGRHAFGHAWAASAGADTYEAVKQMRGQAARRQITPMPETSVIHTHGYGMISTVIVLRGGN